MSSPKQEKHSPNSRARRHSEVVIWQAQKPKKPKTSVSTSHRTIVVPPRKKKCPFRSMLAGMMEPGVCPLRRVQLWHVIPLVLLAIVNLVLVIVALVGFAGYKAALGTQRVVKEFLRADLEYDPYAESDASSDTLVADKQ